MTTVDDLKAAREIVATRWCSKGMLDAEGNVCAMGALNMIASGNPWRLPLNSETNARCNRAAMALQNHLPEEWKDIALYNDADTTTHEDILNLFDKTIANLGGMT